MYLACSVSSVSNVYQRAIGIPRLVYDIVDVLPRGHADRADQLTRAAESVVRNIAEGAGRWSEARKLITEDRYQRGGQLLEGEVAMLTKMI